MPAKKFFIVIAFIVLVGAAALLWIKNQTLQSELISSRAIIAAQRNNNRAMEFLRMFIKNVLKSSSEVDFETRLKLENAVRELKDGKVLVAWQNFVDSKSEAEAQENVKELLSLLVEKASRR